VKRETCEWCGGEADPATQLHAPRIELAESNDPVPAPADANQLGLEA
jgi:hypothetical protein